MNLTPTEQYIYQIIKNEPNITIHLIKTTAKQQKTPLTHKQLEITLTNLINKNLITTQKQILASKTYKTYTPTQLYTKSID